MKIKILLFALFIVLNTGAQNKTGCISGNCKDGKGTYLFTNGDKYEGNFADSHLNGFGKYTDATGNIYTGNFKNDKFNGVGKFVRSDGTKYIGEFVDGKRHGLGTQWFSDTYKEKGKWDNDRFIEDAKFDDFVISEGYDFCTEFNKILSASANNFNDVKGKQVSEYITDSYYCNVQLKELSTVEINNKEGYTGFYYKGEKGEGLKKFEEFYKLIAQCLNKANCTYQNKILNGVAEKKYIYLPANCSSSSNSNIFKVTVEVICKIQGTQSNVVLHITQPN